LPFLRATCRTECGTSQSLPCPLAGRFLEPLLGQCLPAPVGCEVPSSSTEVASCFPFSFQCESFSTLELSIILFFSVPDGLLDLIGLSKQVMNRREAIIAGVAGGVAAAVAVPPVAKAEASPAEHPEVEPIRALLRAHDEAFTNQDLNGVLACFAAKAAIMGTGPGEIWSGPDEIKTAYEHFFEGFDKGEQKFEYQFRIGGVSPQMGWMMTAGNVTGKKGGKDFAFPLNISLTVAKNDEKWLIAAMHFSTLTGGPEAGAKGTQ